MATSTASRLLTWALMTYVLRSEEVLFYRDEFLLAVQDKYVEKRLKQPYGNFDIILIGAFPGQK